MVTSISITSREEAQTAIEMLTAYLTATENKNVEEKAPVKKTPAKRTKTEKPTEEVAAEAKAKTEKAVAKAKALSYEDVVNVAKDVRKKVDLPSVKAVIKEFGGPKISDIPEDKYGDFVEALKAL